MGAYSFTDQMRQLGRVPRTTILEFEVIEATKYLAGHMRFGSVPVVNATGGLKDTVLPYDDAAETGRGFTFQSYNADDFLGAIDRGLGLYYNAPDKWARLVQSDMFLRSAPEQSVFVLCSRSPEPWSVPLSGRLLLGGGLGECLPQRVTLGSCGFCVIEK